MAPRPAMRPSLADPKVALQTLTRFAQSLLRPTSLSDLLWDIAQNIGEILGYEDCVIYLREPEGLVQVAAYGIKNPLEREIFNRIVLPLGKGIVGTVASTGRPERIDDTNTDPRYVHDTFRGKSEMAVPILYGDAVLGVLDSESRERAAYTPEDEAMLVAIATLIAPRIASARAEQDRAVAVRALERHEKELEERERQLREERLEALGKLAGGIAHDFNNLLTAILGNLTMARLDVADEAPVELLRQAEEACMRARGLTKQLLTFSHGGEPIRQVGDLGALTREAVAFALRGSKMKASFDVAQDLEPVSFDEGQMSHVFHSLAINAVQACAGAGTLHVHVRNRPDLMPSSVEVRIHDSGPGIPSENRSRIFDPFFTTRAGGTGLGLATSFWVLRRHGGTLHLDPTVAQGACFVLTLPAVERSLDAPKPPAAHRTLSTARVLAVDDEPSVRTLLSAMGKRFDCSIEAVSTSDAAIDAVRRARAAGRPFDIAVLDLTMPGDRNGHTTLELLRAEDPSIRGVVTSGYHDDPVLARHVDFGFAARLEKPFSLQSLQAALQQALDAN
jgi:signal transduction histidine kinase/ActR/RegA family two-component response regulator